MKVSFEDQFKKELGERGNTLRIQNYVLVNGSDGESEFYSLESIWYEENKSLSITIKNYPNEAEFSSNNSTKIKVYYSDQNDNLLGLAFTLEQNDGEKLDPCNSKKGWNYINVYFPEYTVAIIESTSTSDDVGYIENKSLVPGLNVFLAYEYGDEFEDEELLSRDSYYRFSRQKRSRGNNTPLYLDMNGEKVFSSSVYKHYKSIKIWAANVIGKDEETGDITYQVGCGSEVSILGTVVYDLYQVVNGQYTLQQADLEENLDSTVLTQVGDVTDNYTINQGSKIIRFNSASDVENTTFIASIDFISKIGSKRGHITLKSNSCNFITYLKWTVDYSSNLEQIDDSGNSNIVLLFDSTSGNTGWDYDGSGSRPGRIVIYSQSDVDTSNIVITSGDDTLDRIFANYFGWTITSSGYDTDAMAYKYTIDLRAKQDNLGTSWYPLYRETSILIKNTVKIIGAQEGEKNPSFYCVQRCLCPLEVYQLASPTTSINSPSPVSSPLDNSPVAISGDIPTDDPVDINQGDHYFIIGDDVNDPSSPGSSKEFIPCSLVEFPGTIGYKEVKDLHITSPFQGYSNWEAVVDSDVISLNINSGRLDEVSSLSTSTGFTVYTVLNPSGVTEMNLGTVRFMRRNADKSYDKTNWQDLIYCHPDNDCVLSFNIEREFRNNSWIVNSGTPYFCTSDNTNYRLYLFDRESSASQSFQITTQDLAIYDQNVVVPPVSVTYDDESAFRQFFDISIKGSNVSNTCTVQVTIIPKTFSDSEYSFYDWYPKSPEGNPIGITITRNSNPDVKEKFFCVFKPVVENSIKFYSTNPIAEIEEVKYLNSDGNTSRDKLFYVASTVGEVGEFNYWAVQSKDAETDVLLSNRAVNYGRSLITSLDQSSWATAGSEVYQLRTFTHPVRTEDYYMDSLVIRRCANIYGSRLDFVKDWKNQLVENDIATLKVGMEGAVPSESLSVFRLNEEGDGLVKLEDDEPLELDYIGLYKIYVRSNSGFRVSIGEPRDNFYFYDTHHNQPKLNILTQDEGSYDSITGREVCFAYYGNEIGAFRDTITDQTLPTYIRVTNLSDNTSIYIPLHRRYFDENRKAVLDTNIKYTGNNTEIFTDASDKVSVECKSNLETVGHFESNYYSGLARDVINSSDVDLEYNIFNSVGKYTRMGTTKVFRARGYVQTTVNFDLSSLSTSSSSFQSSSYPISPLGSLVVSNPATFNGEELSFPLYITIGAPEVRVSNSNVYLAKRPGEPESFDITVSKGGKYKVFIATATDDSTDYLWRELEEGSDSIDSDDTGNPDFTLNRSGDTFTVISQKDFENNPDMDARQIGLVRFVPYIDHNNFIKRGNPEVLVVDDPNYTQERVDSIVGAPSSVNSPKSIDVHIRRKYRDYNTLTLDQNTSSIVSWGGDAKDFILEKINMEDPVNVEAFKSEWEGFVNNITVPDATNKLKVVYKGKLDRHEYPAGGYEVAYENKYNTETRSYDQLDEELLRKLKKYNSAENSNISIEVGGVRVSTESITQEPINTGIKYNNNLFFGKQNEPIKVYADWDYGTTSIAILVGGFYLPEGEETDFHINSSTDTGPGLIVNTQGNLVQSGTPYHPRSRDVVIIPGIDHSVEAGVAGHFYKDTWVYIFKFPSNESIDSNIYIGNIDVETSDRRNRVELEIYAKPRERYRVSLFRNYYTSSNGYYCYEQEEIDSISFSASSRMRGTNMSSHYNSELYLMTDAPEPLCSFYISTSDIRMSDNVQLNDSMSWEMSESLEGNFIGIANIRDSNDSDVNTGWRLYRIIPKSKVSKFSFKTDGVHDVTAWMSHKPYRGTTEIGLGSHGEGCRGFAQISSYYGACEVCLTNTCTTYLSIESDPSSFSNTIADFSQFSETEAGKYLSGSLFRANTKVVGNGVIVDNTIYLQYLDDPNSSIYKWTNPRGVNMWQSYGYWAAFKFCDGTNGWRREEWDYINDDWVVTDYSDFNVKGSDYLRLIEGNSNYGYTKVDTTIYDSYSTPHDYSYTVNIPNYVDTRGHHIGDTFWTLGGILRFDIDQDTRKYARSSNEPGLIIKIPAYDFVRNLENVYTSSLQFTVGGHTLVDDIEFNIDIALVLKQ